MHRYESQVDLMELLRRIGPLNRTLANRETDRALDIVSKYLPGARIEGFPCGAKAWTWTLPMRWEVESARIEGHDGVLVDYDWHPLHLVNYSQPFSGKVSHEELMAHIHTSPSRPDAIPFVFSYYLPTWGFSVPHNWLPMFRSKAYRVEISSRFESGNLNLLSCLIPGRSEYTIVICSNICHPTQVNDSLTGVAAAVEIARWLLARPNRKYSYLVLVLPETIGSIAYFANHPEMLNKAVGGIFSEMLGTDGPLVGKRTRQRTGYLDGLLEDALANSKLKHHVVGFFEGASNDDKVMDSPGVNIPTISLTRYPYPEYHTSDDNLNIVNIERLREGINVLQTVIDNLERDYIPMLKYPGPVFLSGYGLYPDWRNKPELEPLWKSYLDVLYAIDGKRSIAEIAHHKKLPLDHVAYWTDAFAEKCLLEKRVFIFSGARNHQIGRGQYDSSHK